MLTCLPKISLVMSSVYLTNREILSGFLRYARLNVSWALSLATGRADEPDAGDLVRKGCDALVTDSDDPALYRKAERLGIRVITVLSQAHPKTLVARISADHRRISELAADHFLSLGFKSFAYVGDLADSWWSRERCEMFTQRLADNGHTVHVHASKTPLADWLKSLPRPVAILAANDNRARQLLNVCQEQSLAVPMDVAIIGVDNDELLCETACPPITSIAWNAEETGYRVAAFLDGLLKAKRLPKQPRIFLYSGQSLVIRKSALMNATRDPITERARELIEANFHVKSMVKSIADEMGITVRMLERRFLAATGRTLRDEIRDVRVRRARALIAQGNLTREEVALKCGFYDASHLHKAMKSSCDRAPTGL